ncbi:hypothetical protein BH23BAC4_BH23BAC4_04750 [soil metagenome]
MSWFSRLLLLFLVVPILEFWLLLRLGAAIGFLHTVLLIVLTAVVGSYLTQREGVSAWRRFRDRISRGEMPGDELLSGIVILLSGALLLTPGVITDIVGLLGLLPPSRRVIGGYIARRMKDRVITSTSATFFSAGGRFRSSGPTGGTPGGPTNEDDTGLIEESPSLSDRTSS